MKGGIKVALVFIAFVSHITGYYIVGLKTQDANGSSWFFTLAISTLLVEQDFLPKTSCPLPKTFVYSYKVAEMLTVNTLALQNVWAPFGKTVYDVNQVISKALCNIPAMKHAPLDKIPEIISSRRFAAVELIFIALYMLKVVLTSTGAYNKIINWLKEQKNKMNKPVCVAVPLRAANECSDDDEDEDEYTEEDDDE